MKNSAPNKVRITVLPSQEELNRVLMYNQSSGLLIWRSRPRSDFRSDKSHAVWNARYAGTPALNSLHKSGYLHGRLFGIPVKSHRVIWKMMTGYDAEVIDHRDGIRSNNSWENLTNSTDGKNAKNQKLYANNKSGAIGVYWHSSNRKWHASIRSEGNKINLGFFENIEDAKQARLKAESDLGFSPNHGRLVS